MSVALLYVAYAVEVTVAIWLAAVAVRVRRAQARLEARLDRRERDLEQRQEAVRVTYGGRQAVLWFEHADRGDDRRSV